jgi:hypothetical protein
MKLRLKFSPVVLLWILALVILTLVALSPGFVWSETGSKLFDVVRGFQQS